MKDNEKFSTCTTQLLRIFHTLDKKYRPGPALAVLCRVFFSEDLLWVISSPVTLSPCLVELITMARHSCWYICCNFTTVYCCFKKETKRDHPYWCHFRFLTCLLFNFCSCSGKLARCMQKNYLLRNWTVQLLRVEHLCIPFLFIEHEWRWHAVDYGACCICLLLQHCFSRSCLFVTWLLFMCVWCVRVCCAVRVCVYNSRASRLRNAQKIGKFFPFK